MVRFKNRWLLIEFLPPGPAALAHAPPSALEGKHIFAALRESVLAHFGDAGWGAVAPSLTVKYWSPTTRMAIVRVAREHARIARGAATLLDDLGGAGVVPHVVHVSGTIKHAQLAAIAHDRAVVARFRARAGTAAAYRDSYGEYLERSGGAILALQD